MVRVGNGRWEERYPGIVNVFNEAGIIRVSGDTGGLLHDPVCDMDLFFPNSDAVHHWIRWRYGEEPCKDLTCFDRIPASQ